MRGRLCLTKGIIEVEVEVGALWSGRNDGRRMHWDIGAGQKFPVIHSAPFRTGRHLDLMQWGLIVAWKDDTKIVSTTVDCHAQVSEWALRCNGPRSAVRRCLIPFDRFYDQQIDSHEPLAIAPTEGPLMTFGAIWEPYQSPTGTCLSCFAILITDTDEALGKSHQRMPVIIPAGARAEWLGEETNDSNRITKLLAPYVLAA
jgi:putative SOS response-associated peptidase YedK